MDKYTKAIGRNLRNRIIYGIICLVIITLFVWLVGGCSKEADIPTENRLTIVSINPGNGSSITGNETITAELEYQVSINETENEGFYIYIWFTDADGWTVGNNKRRIVKRSGNYTFTYPVQNHSGKVEFYFELVTFITANGFNPLAQTERIEYFP